MHPTIIKLGRFAIHGYGLMLALSFLLGIYLAIYRSKRRGVDPNHIMDLSVWIVISAILGARLFWVVFHLEEFRGRWWDIINPFQSSGQIGIGGLTMLGGVILALITGVIYLGFKKLPVLKVGDVVIPSVALGIFITRIGCFLNGCCYGKPSKLPWALIFPPESVAGFDFPNTPLHPTQLYCSLGGLIIFITLLVVEKYKKFDGFLLFLFLILYSVARFLVDFVRYYESSMIFMRIGNTPLTVNQGLCFFLFLIGVFFMTINIWKIKK